MGRRFYKDYGYLMPNFELGVGFGSTDWSKVDDGIAPNGCTWYRCMLPGRQLIRAKIPADVGFLSIRPNGMFSIQRPGENRSKPYKIIVLKVIMNRFVLNGMDKAQQKGQKIVVDIDDLFDEIHETNMAHGSTDASKDRDNNREIYKEIIAKADAIICSTPFIYEYYRARFPDKPMFMIRNSIDADRWTRMNAVNRQPTIGWLGATPWRSLDLEQLADFFGDYIEKRDLMFHHAGHIAWAPPAFMRLGIENKKRLSVSPMVPLYELPDAYGKFDIGIVPLNDIPFNRAKSYIKGLEYAAAGIPFVASALPEYEYLSECGIGRVASTPKEWMSSFDELLDVDMRQDESLHNREIVNKEFTIEAHAQQWVNAFKEIAKL